MDWREGRMLASLVGLTMVLGAVGYFTLSHFPMIGQALDGENYLLAVLFRCTENPYQAAMLSGWMAFVVLGLYIVLGNPTADAVSAFDVFAAWTQTIFTSFGFLGTIIGISIAVSGLEAAMVEKDPGRLVDGLSAAFDTTFLGLAAAISAMVLRKLGQLWRSGE